MACGRHSRSYFSLTKVALQIDCESSVSRVDASNRMSNQSAEGSRSSQDSYSQQVELRSSIHGPLQCFQAVYVTFCRSAAPFILESGGHGRAVAFQSFRNLYCFIILLHERRRVVHFNVTDHPTAAWTAQQLIEAFPDNTAPRFLLRDRDS